MDIDVTNGGQSNNLVSNTQHGSSNMGDKDSNVYESSAADESSHHYVDRGLGKPVTMEMQLTVKAFC